MGVDARILVRGVPRETITDEWLKSTSWDLCESIGAGHFFTSDGLPPAEYEEASSKWHAAFDGHRLYPEFMRAQDHDTRTMFRDQIVADIGGACPEARRLAIEPTLIRYREDDDPEPGAAYYEDAEEPILAVDGECLLEVSVWTRYYGVGYERGDILTLCAIAEWLEVNIPGCEVWYGGDSSGICAEPFTDTKRRALRRHLYSSSGRAYFAHSWCERAEYGIPPACSLCPGGRYCGTRFGSGRNFASFSCAGCGKSVETRDGGGTWNERKDAA